MKKNLLNITRDAFALALQLQDAKTTAALIAWVNKAKINCSTGECKFYVGCPTEFAGHYCKS